MTPSEYQELTTFFVDQLGRHQRETAVIVESLRHDIRLVADGVLEAHRRIDANGARIDANTRAIEDNTRRIEANGARIDALTQRVERLETAVSTRFDDHEMRLRALER